MLVGGSEEGLAYLEEGGDQDRSRLVDITTDHPVVSTAVQIVGESPDSDKSD